MLIGTATVQPACITRRGAADGSVDGARAPPGATTRLVALGGLRVKRAAVGGVRLVGRETTHGRCTLMPQLLSTLQSI
jgi:hypothetical protein